MKKVVIRAPLMSRSGYGEHSRQVFRYLLTVPNIELKAQCVPWGITPWYSNTKDCNGLIGEIVKRSNAAPEEKFDVSLQVILPNEWDASLAKFNIGLTAGVETDVCNPMWGSTHCQKMDMVIVPSDHTRKSLKVSAEFDTPIYVIPESYFEELSFEPGDLDLNLTTEFNFLTVGVLTGTTPDTDRKNLFYLIKWFIEEFKNKKDVGLIIKTNHGRETTIDKTRTRQTLEKLINELGHDGSPKIYLLHGGMTRSEMNSLYKHKEINALVSATRGEGFGLPMLEAAVAGLPVIATNWSAHTEFLNSGKWLSVDYDLVRLHKHRVDNQIFMPTAKWAMPQEKSFKKVIRKFYTSHRLPTDWAESLSKKLKEDYSPESINDKYKEILTDILG